MSGSPRARSKGPASFQELKALAREDTVGGWSSTTTQTASQIAFTFNGTKEIYSVEKLRAHLGEAVCLPVAIYTLDSYRWVRCLSKGQPGIKVKGT